jgi:hypothetical protein
MIASGGLMVEFFVLVAGMMASGDPSLNFLTVPRIYAKEQCEVERLNLVDRLNHPRDGEKVMNEVRAECVNLPSKNVLLFIKRLENGLETHLRNFDHLLTFASKLSGNTSYIVIPFLVIDSRENCLGTGRSIAQRDIGTKFGNGVVEDVLYNCVPTTEAEAREIVADYNALIATGKK